MKHLLRAFLPSSDPVHPSIADSARRAPAASLALALLSLDTLSAQSTQTASKSCDGRIDIATLPPGFGAVHAIVGSGSYVLNRPMNVPPGQTAVAIGPNASSVEIDGRGFPITGDPSHTSVSAIVCPPSPVQRSSLRLRDIAIADMTGDGISARNVGVVWSSSADLGIVGGAGLRVQDCGSVHVEDSSFSQCATGIDATSVSSLAVEGAVIVSGGIGVRACANTSRLQDVVVLGGSDGVAYDDTCLATGSPEPLSGQAVGLIIIAGVSVGYTYSRSTPGPVQLSLERCNIGSSGQSGVAIDVGGPLDLSISHSSASGNGGDGLRVDAPVQNGKVNISLLDTEALRNGGHGVSVSGTDAATEVSLSACSTSDNGGDGLRVFGTQPAVEVRDSFMNRNAGNGVSVTGGALDVKSAGSSFSHNGGRGIDILGTSGTPGGGSGGAVLLERSSFQWNQLEGCKVDFSASPTKGRVVFGPENVFARNYYGYVVIETDSDGRMGGTCTDNTSDGAVVQRASNADFEGWTWSRNGGDGIHVEDSNASFRRCTAVANAGDGVDVQGLVIIAAAMTAFNVTRQNGGWGFHAQSCALSCQELRSDHNVLGGLSCSSSSGVLASCTVTGSTFDSNGGVGLDIQNAHGGEVSRCVAFGSSTGIHVGDPNGSGGCSGVRVCDNTVSTCSTGYSVDPNGATLVLRNFASGCTSGYSVGAGNVFGPIVTSADIATSSNPNANYAP